MRRFGAVLAILVPAAVLYAQDTGYVKARGKPASAAVFIDGKYIGPASRFTVPEKYATPAGEAEVTLREPRYEDYTTKVTVTARKTAKIHYSLKKLPVPEPPFGRFRLGGGEPESFLSVVGDTGAVNGAGWSTRMSGTLSVLWDKWIIDGLFVNGVAMVTRLASYPVRLVQWGLVQWYALVMVAGLVGFVFYYVVRW